MYWYLRRHISCLTHLWHKYYVNKNTFKLFSLMIYWLKLQWISRFRFSYVSPVNMKFINEFSMQKLHHVLNDYSIMIVLSLYFSNRKAIKDWIFLHFSTFLQQSIRQKLKIGNSCEKDTHELYIKEVTTYEECMHFYWTSFDMKWILVLWTYWWVKC